LFGWEVEEEEKKPKSLKDVKDNLLRLFGVAKKD